MSPIRSHSISAAGTVVVLLLVFLFLLYTDIPLPVPVEDEGIEIAFGNADDGGGMPELAPIAPQPQAAQKPAPAAPSRPSDNDLMVQDDEALLALARQREEDAKRKADEQVLIQQQREQEARLEAERQAKEKALAEKRAEQEEKIAKANQAMAGFGQTLSAMGANGGNPSTADAAGVKGNPVGKGFGSVNSNTWTLHGRDCKVLPKPSQDFNQSGRVVVNIMVNENGDVLTASVGDGTNISDRKTQQLALDAARRAKFTKGDKPQRGSIVYTFKIN